MKKLDVVLLSGLLVWAGCSSKPEPVPLGPYSRAPKTIERTVKIDLGDGRKGTVQRTEVDLDDYIALINSVPVKELDKAPRPLSISSPVYPLNLRKKKVEGVAEIYLIVDERGMVESARVKSADYREFGEAAVAAVLSWRFEPMTKNGKPTKAAFLQVFPFTMD